MAALKIEIKKVNADLQQHLETGSQTAAEQEEQNAGDMCTEGDWRFTDTISV